MAVIQFKGSRTVEFAFHYLSRGIALTPLHPDSKRPIKREWQENIVTNKDKANIFQGRNIGFILGSHSGGLTDIDLDTEEARILAPMILPPTPWIFGRESNRKSHYLYIVKKSKTRKYIVPGGSNSVILEIRSDGAQTMAPGSIHPDGERVRWESNDWNSESPSTVELSVLTAACNKLAAAALVLRHGWVSGKRDDVAVALCGLLLRADWDPTEIDDWLGAIAKAEGDEELEMRLKADYQADRLAKNERVPGIPRLMDLMGKEVTEKVIDWLGIKDVNGLEKINELAGFIIDGGRKKVLLKGRNIMLDLMSAKSHFATFKVKKRNANGKTVEARAFSDWEEWAGRCEYHGLTFDPEGPQEQSGYYNLWQGFEDDPYLDLTLREARDGCQYFLHHLSEYVCQGDEGHYQYLIDWMSHLVQRPEEVPAVALVLRGDKGTGKTIVAQYINRMFGNRDYGVIITNPKHIFTRFNGALRNRLFTCLDDIQWAGGHEEENILKNIITGSELTLERKFADVEKVRSYIRLMIATNSDWAVPVGHADRRYFVLDLPAWLAPKNPKVSVSQKRRARVHFENLRAEMKGEGPRYLFSYLSRRGIKTESFVHELPITQGYLDCQQLSIVHQSPLQSWIQDCLGDKLWWNKTDTPLSKKVIISTDALYNMYVASLDRKRSEDSLSKIVFTKRLRTLLPSIEVKHRQVESKKTASGRTSYRVYVIPSYSKIVAEYRRETGIPLS